MTTRRIALASLSLALAATTPATSAPRSYQRVVLDVARMVENERAQSLAGRRSLEFLNVLWEDTARYEGSSVGPNISDVTIEVEYEDRRGKLRSALMPVLRHPNFSDRTADIKLSKFHVRVGNQRKGGQLTTIPLRELLANPAQYLSSPEHGRIKGGSLLARRDSHLLVSAQAAFLPIRAAGGAIFRPVIFNYQSSRRRPAVLVILVTREGTSMTIIDNHRDAVWGTGQRLFFNAGGERAAITAERLSEVRQRGTTADGQSAASLGQDANLLLMIQVPLRVRALRRPPTEAQGDLASGAVGGPQPKKAARSKDGGRRSDVEEAVLGHGRLEGPFVELDGLTIERDRRFPIRATVQLYQATSNGVVSARDIARLARQIAFVYRKGDFVGSLVTPDENAARRPTRWTGAGPAPAGLSAEDFPGLVERARRYGWKSLAWLMPSPVLYRW
jgi:hypothetical protein